MHFVDDFNAVTLKPRPVDETHNDASPASIGNIDIGSDYINASFISVSYSLVILAITLAI